MTNNGCEIFKDDYNHLRHNECIYVCPISKDFNYFCLLDMYTKSCKLGSGGFGNVYKLKHKLNKEIVAAKFVRVSEYLHKADTIQQILKEAQYLMTLDHENILKLQTAFLISQEIAIITEYILIDLKRRMRSDSHYISFSPKSQLIGTEVQQALRRYRQPYDPHRC